MDNRVLFRDGPLRITCAGCGKEFYAEEISRCRACGNYFCRECRKTHDCRKDPSETYVPSFLPPAALKAPEKTDAGLKPPELENRSALIPTVQSEKIPYKNTGMILSDDEAYIAYVREVNPLIKCESCGEEYPNSDIWVCPDCGAVLCQICRQKHKCPKPEGEQNKLLALLPFTKEKKRTSPNHAPVTHAPSSHISPKQILSGHPSSNPASPDAVSVEKPAAKQVPAAVKMLTCDHCGKTYPASKLRKCKSCGAVLCPKCRLLHSCSSASDATEITQVKPVSPKKREPFVLKKPEKAKKIPAAESADEKSTAPKKTAAKKKDWDELIICDSCGEPYLKSNMRKCRLCGAVLCPKCRRKHTCGEKKE